MNGFSAVEYEWNLLNIKWNLKGECQGHALRAHIRIGGHFIGQLVGP